MSRSFSTEKIAPIGVFDSGLGGLTVVQRIRELLPRERIVYVADQAHVPYGGRELGEVCGFACGISAALLRYGCRAVVMACNISSATALTYVQAENPHLPILGVILPGAQAAAAQTRNRRIGVLATEGTVKSHAYRRALHAIDPGLVVEEVACPAFVPLVESGELVSAEARQAAQSYLAPLKAAGVDTVVLGCTHYPFLLPILQELQPDLKFVDPAVQTACALADALGRSRRRASPITPSTSPTHLLFTTGDSNAFSKQLQRFLPQGRQNCVVAQAAWAGDRLFFKS